MNRSRWGSLGLGLMVLGIGLGFTSRPIPGWANGQGRVVPPEQASDVNIMEEKLLTAQEVLTALVNRDAPKIELCGKRLSALCKTDAWKQAGNDPVYNHFSIEFQRLADRLRRMGELKNFEGAAYIHQSLTATCIACHDHVRDVAPLK